MTHDEYKNTGNPNSSSISNEKNSDADKSTASSEVNNTQADTSTPETKPSASTPDDDDNEDKFPYAYAGFVPKETNVNVDVSKIIVNGNYTLPESYSPTLADIVSGSDAKLDYRVAPYYRAMYDAALADGITLTPVSGYRSYERQKNNFEALIQENTDKGMDEIEATKEAAKVIMVPGSSEHNAGIAVDICSLSQSFENTEEFEWLSKNAADYGFILRYPKDEKSQEITGVVYEPWHYRYVGVNAAKEINSKGITFEEYLGLD